MTENKTKVSEELSKAGEASVITPLLLELDKLRIVSTSAIEDEEFLFNINGKPCLPRKDLTVITGQPKTGKTMLISILMACCARGFASYGKASIDTFNQNYIIRYPENPDCPWEWDFRKLFGRVMGGRSVMSYGDFEETAMREAHILRQTYFEKIFSEAEAQRVIRKTNDRCGRVVVMLLPE